MSIGRVFSDSAPLPTTVVSNLFSSVARRNVSQGTHGPEGPLKKHVRHGGAFLWHTWPRGSFFKILHMAQGSIFYSAMYWAVFFKCAQPGGTFFNDVPIENCGL